MVSLKIYKFLLLILIFSILNISSLIAQENKVEIYMFYGQGCRYCDKLSSFLDEVQEKYPSLIVKKYEIYFNDENRKLFEDLSEAYGYEIGGVPTTFINNNIIGGFCSPKSLYCPEDTKEIIEKEIQNCLNKECESPEKKIKTIEGKTKLTKTLTIPAVISAAVVDAINPCAFAVLIILLTTILAVGVKKRVLMAGLAFIASIYISYFLMGIGLYSAIQASGLTHKFYTIVAVLAIIVGLFNLKDYLWYGKWFRMEVPMSWRPKLKCLLKGVTSVPGAFLIGFVVSLFLLPCTSGPYIIILGLLAETTTQSYAFMLLLLYNLVFILPMVIITLVVYLGFTTTEKAEEWRIKNLKILHLIAGIMILCLGIGMFIAMWLGMV